METPNSIIPLVIISVLIILVSIGLLNNHSEHRKKVFQKRISKINEDINTALNEIPWRNVHCIDENGRMLDSINHFQKPIKNLNNKLDKLISLLPKQPKKV